jgi:hypothetical protein
MAIGLGSVDMPVPAIAEWEWLNWKFPRPVRAGDTIYAHWMLTQKRPPVGGAASSIAVWRVDVLSADGALCAEGEIGAKVTRAVVATRREAPEAATTGPATTPRRRRRRSRANGPAPVPEPPPVAAPPASAAKPERAAGPSRRRRRRRSSSSTPRDDEHEPRAAHVPETPAPPSPSTSTPPASRRGLGGVLRRLRGT